MQNLKRHTTPCSNSAAKLRCIKMKPDGGMIGESLNLLETSSDSVNLSMLPVLSMSRQDASDPAHTHTAQ